jgi:K+-sensing histidine kinase KdpD
MVDIAISAATPTLSLKSSATSSLISPLIFADSMLDSKVSFSLSTAVIWVSAACFIAAGSFPPKLVRSVEFGAKSASDSKYSTSLIIVLRKARE